MGLVENLIGLGTPPEQATTLSSFRTDSVPSNTTSGDLTSTGNNFATALQLTALVNRIATTSSGSGIKLPDTPVGAMVVIVNDGQHMVNLFPFTNTETLNNGVAGAAVTIAQTHVNIAIRQSATNWFVLRIDKETT